MISLDRCNGSYSTLDDSSASCASDINYAHMRSLVDDSVVTCDEIIDAVGKS